MKLNSFIKKFLLVMVLVSAIYGIGRLYYAFTGGFSITNITSDLTYDERWKVHDLTPKEKGAVDQALDQEYVYLGKGCQAYVFASQDGKYVLKFFKYQRFRPQAWINLFAFIPAIEQYQEDKAHDKKEKLDKVFRSWKIAYENLQPETGVVYVHLNKTDNLNKNLTLRDKLGRIHQINLDKMEFLVQQRATMLSPTIDTMIQQNQEDQALGLIDNLLRMLVSEYERGYAVNDHALMQNTGVINGRPIHIDVGQFIYNDIVRSPKVYKQEIYDKTYKLRGWLEKHYPDLAYHLKARMNVLLDVDYFYMGPYKHKGDVAKIPHQD